MKTVIMAAGAGSRLKHLTADRPKTMLKIFEKTLIYYIVTALLKNEMSDITVVLGYQHEKLTKYLGDTFPNVNFNFIINPDYKSKDNIYSLYLASPHLQGDDLLVINADLFCEDILIKKAIEAPFNAMMVDGNAQYTEEASKVKIDEAGYISNIGKNFTKEEWSGEYIGILKLLKNSTQLYFEQIAQMVKGGDVHVGYSYGLRKILPIIGLKPVFTDQFL